MEAPMKTVNRDREAAESEFEIALFTRNLFVLTMLGSIGFLAATAYVMLH